MYSSHTLTRPQEKKESFTGPVIGLIAGERRQPKSSVGREIAEILGAVRQDLILRFAAPS
jgi:hypothetical protein